MTKEAKTIAKNRRALHDYEIVETYEAGIALKGCEVRSLRDNNCQLTDCFAIIRNGELQKLPYIKLLPADIFVCAGLDFLRSRCE